MTKSGKPDGRGRHGKHARGDRHGRWIGGRRIDKNGYILVRVGTEYEREHRLVVESLIGRKLEEREAVHHIDNNRQNNIPENLELTTWSHHRTHHDREIGRDQYGRFPGSTSVPMRDSRGRFIGRQS